MVGRWGKVCAWPQGSPVTGQEQRQDHKTQERGWPKTFILVSSLIEPHLCGTVLSSLTQAASATSRLWKTDWGREDFVEISAAWVKQNKKIECTCRLSPKLRLAQGKMKDATKAHQVIQLHNQSKVPKAEWAMCKTRCLSLGRSHTG